MTYWIRTDRTPVDGESLDAYMCMTGIRGNSECVYENATYDETILLQAYETISSLTVPVFGPHPIPMRGDRDNHWRDIKVTVLGAGGSDADGCDVDIYLLPEFRRPNESDDEFVTLKLGGGITICTWSGPVTLTLPTWQRPSVHRVEDDDGPVKGHVGYVCIMLNSTKSANARFSGVRIAESLR